MSSIPFPAQGLPPDEPAPRLPAQSLVPDDYLNKEYTVRSWLLTVDHKRIAILYLIGISVFFLVGGALATIIRFELATPKGDVVSGQTYNKMFTMHGVVMIFFFLIPSIPAVFGNFVLPIMLGAKDLAFPKLNLLSWYLYMIGGVMGVIVMLTGGVDTGWTFYPPYSTMFAKDQVELTIAAAFITGFSSILTGLNFIATIHTMRCPGLTWFRLPLFVWAMYATSLIQILGTPVLAISLLLIFLERAFGLGIFDPNVGGDPVLFQHLFWFYSHPAVYIMILPSQGVVSELVSNFSRKRVFGYPLIAFSSLTIAVVGFAVWGHHMFTSSQSVYAGLVFAFISMMVAVPTAIKVFNWTATLYRGSVWWRTPLLYALYFIGFQVLGGLTGIYFSAIGIDTHLHDTYFVVAHFHYIMVGGALMGFLGALHYWWPKMFGRMYPEWIAQFAAFVIFVGFNLTFFPQFFLGVNGMPRRYHEYPPEYQVLHVMSSAGASILAFGMLIPVVYLLWSLRYGKAAGPNPWGAVGLEWTTASPPPTENFKQAPVVTWEAYEFKRQEPEVVRAGKDDASLAT